MELITWIENWDPDLIAIVGILLVIVLAETLRRLIKDIRKED